MSRREVTIPELSWEPAAAASLYSIDLLIDLCCCFVVGMEGTIFDVRNAHNYKYIDNQLFVGLREVTQQIDDDTKTQLVVFES